MLSKLRLVKLLATSMQSFTELRSISATTPPRALISAIYLSLIKAGSFRALSNGHI